METHRLGRTGLEAGLVSVGTEHLLRQPRDVVVSVIGQAIEQGVNYFDVVFSHPHYLDNLGAAFVGQRGRVLLTTHLGSTVKDDQYCRSRSVAACQAAFDDSLRRLDTDHTDVLFLHNFNRPDEWDQVSRPGGVVDLALRLRDRGSTRVIGVSGHGLEVLRQSVQSGVVDLLMLPVNLLVHAMPGRRALLDMCVEQGIGVVAMKPYGGGRLLMGGTTVRVPSYQTGGESFKAKVPRSTTPERCLSYVLAQVGVSTALVGVKSTDELSAALRVLEASDEERDFSGLLAAFGRYVEGECVYCNHCLPCPERIDVAEVMRLLDAAQFGVAAELREAYAALSVPASACTECGACEVRCPFGVAVIAKMRDAARLYAA